MGRPGRIGQQVQKRTVTCGYCGRRHTKGSPLAIKCHDAQVRERWRQKRDL